MRPPRSSIPAIALLLSLLIAFLVVGVLWVAGAPFGEGVDSLRWRTAAFAVAFVLISAAFAHFCP